MHTIIIIVIINIWQYLLCVDRVFIRYIKEMQKIEDNISFFLLVKVTWQLLTQNDLVNTANKWLHSIKYSSAFRHMHFTNTRDMLSYHISLRLQLFLNETLHPIFSICLKYWKLVPNFTLIVIASFFNERFSISFMNPFFLSIYVQNNKNYIQTIKLFISLFTLYETEFYTFS